MTTHRRYHATDTGPFGQLVRVRELAGFRLEPAPPREVWDLFVDTPETALLRRGLTLRLRKHGSTVTGSLRAGDRGEELASARWTEEGALNGSPEIPESELLAAIRREIGDVSLVRLLKFHQYRTPRAFFSEDRLAGVLSLDVVADQTHATNQVVTSEVEIELTDGGSADDLTALDEMLQGLGFIPDPYSKFERGIIRLGSDEHRTLLLLPSERSALEAARDGGSGVGRRRAEVVLLAADGSSEEEVSRYVGLATSRVAHWIDGFRARRMKAMDEAAPDPRITETESPELPTYRVSEVVGSTGASIHIERDDPPPEFRRVMSVLQPSETTSDDGAQPGTDHPPEIEPVPEETDLDHPPEIEPVSQEIGLDHPLEIEAGAEPVAEEEESGHDGELEIVSESSGEPPANPFAEMPSLAGLAPEQSLFESMRGLAAWVEAEIAELSVVSEDDLERSSMERGQALTHAVEFAGALRMRALGGASRPLEESVAGYRRVMRSALSLERSRGQLEPRQEGESMPVAVALAMTVWAVDLRRILQEQTPAVEDLLEALQTLRVEADEHDAGGGAVLASVLPELLWARLGRLRTVATRGAIPAHLPELEECTDAILFALALFPDSETGEVSAILAELRNQIDQVATDADLALQLDGFISDWIVPGAAADPTPLQARLGTAEEAAVEALADLDATLATVQAHDFRRLIGEVAASV